MSLGTSASHTGKNALKTQNIILKFTILGPFGEFLVVYRNTLTNVNKRSGFSKGQFKKKKI